jgi:hypothetical protein
LPDVASRSFRRRGEVGEYEDDCQIAAAPLKTDPAT